MADLKIGLQLISVKDVSGTDLLDVIRRVADVGYEGVEFARGYYGKTAEQLKATLDDVGMVAISDHVQADDLKRDFDLSMHNCKVLGMKQVVSWGNFCVDHHVPSAEEVDQYIESLSDLSRRLMQHDIKLTMHDSAQSFVKNGKKLDMFEYILDTMGSELVNAQVDIAWSICAGNVPAHQIRKYAGRIPTVHIKDFYGPVPVGDIYEIQGIAQANDCPVGVPGGVQDVPGILRACLDSGVEWLIVEHMEREVYEDSIKATAVSLENIKKALKNL